MPILDGISATKMLKQLYGDDCPPIVAMTANAFDEDREKSFDAGMSDFLAKPIDLENLRRVLGNTSGTSNKSKVS